MNNTMNILFSAIALFVGTDWSDNNIRFDVQSMAY